MFRSVGALSLEDALRNSDINRAIVARAFLQLLQSSVRLDSVQGMAVLPETLALDAERLAKMRDVIDKMSLECSTVITSRQLLGRSVGRCGRLD